MRRLPKSSTIIWNIGADVSLSLVPSTRMARRKRNGIRSRWERRMCFVSRTIPCINVKCWHEVLPLGTLYSIAASLLPVAFIMSKSNSIKLAFPAEAATKDYAASLDSSDSLAAFRDKFIVPSKANIASKKLAKPGVF